nr:cysteine-rich receptor-like protein kinase 6 [Oryza sativa Japonica Group]
MSRTKTRTPGGRRQWSRPTLTLWAICLSGRWRVVPMLAMTVGVFNLSDSDKRQQLDWRKRFMIIYGIARGLLYLHEESSQKIIHRDHTWEMNPKISDFGLARAFGGDQSKDITRRRPVGTLGYMSPEYAYCGHVSTKSDMFSFGVIVLEMVTGRRNNGIYASTRTDSSECMDSIYLLSYVWEKWRTRSLADAVDASLGGRYRENEVLSCVQIGLLCVQENPADRPDISAVVLMLSSNSMSLRTPSKPAFFFGSGGLAVDAGAGHVLLGTDDCKNENAERMYTVI